MKKKIFFGISCLLCFATLSCRLNAQDTSGYFFESFSTLNGLSSNTVTDILQDDDGFIWIATGDGLNRYDGTEVKQFLYNSSGNSIPSNNTYCLSLLPGKILGVGTATGVSFYDLQKRTFNNYFYKDSSGLNNYDNNVFEIERDSSGNIWLGAMTCIIKLSPQKKLLKIFRSRHTKNDIGKERFGFVQKILPLEGDNMLLMTTEGNFIYESVRDTILRTSQSMHSQFSFLSDKRSWEFFPAGAHRYIFFKNGVDSIFLFNYRTGKVSSAYYAFNRQPYHLFLRKVCRLDSTVYYINDQLNGFSLVNIRNDSITASGKLLNSNTPFGKAMQDQQGNWWAISQLGGLLKKSREQNKIQFIPIQKLSHKYAISSIKKIDRSTWLAVYGGGIIIIDSAGNEKQVRLKNGSDDIWPNYVWQFWQYNRDTVWVGTASGLFWLNKRNFSFGRLRGFKGKPAVLDSFATTTQFRDHKGRMWIGIGGGKGICIYYPETKTFRHLKGRDSLGYVFRYPVMIKEDNTKRLWFTSDNINRLLYWDEVKEQMIPVALPQIHETISSFTALHIDKQNIFWIGTHNSGLVRFDPATQSVAVFGRDRGICNSFIDDIYEDENNRLWITTRGGLASFNKQNETFVNYYKKDGLNNGFLECNIYKDETTGLIYSGGYGGLIAFRPADITMGMGELVKLKITDIYINGHAYGNLLTDRLSLSSSEKNISVSFSTIDMVNGPMGKYFYRVSGSEDTSWVSLGQQRQLNFSNLSAGSYTLSIRSANESGSWNSEPVNLHFNIKPAFTQTTWFYLMLLLLGAGILYVIYRYRVSRLLEMERVRSNISRDLHDEIGANLTNISYLTLLAQKNVNEPVQVTGLLNRIYDDSRTVSESMREIVWSINPDNDTLEKALPRMLHYATEMLEAKGIHVQASFPDKISNIQLSMEQRRDLYLIFKEAVNNLARHSLASSAKIHFSYRSGIISMRIEDNGKGIGPSGFSQSNGIKNMQERARRHSWDIAITSVPANGTSIAVEAKIA